MLTTVLRAATLVLFLSFFVRAEPAVPPGFANLGTVLPEDGGSTKCVYDLIKEKKLKYKAVGSESWGIEPTEAERQRGYVVYARPALVPINSWSVPDRRVQTLSTFTTAGEYEPVTFAVYAFKDISDFKISVSALTDGRGNSIDAVNVDVRTVSSMPFVTNKEEYHFERIFLTKPARVDLKKEESAWFWLTLYTPPATPAGTYTAQIKLSGQGESADLGLRVRVLPFTLSQTDRLYGMCFNTPGRPDLYPENLDKYYNDMRAHGMNSQWIWPDAGIEKKGEKAIYDFSKYGFCRKEERYFGASLDTMMAAYLKAGFTNFWICGTVDPLWDLIETNLHYKPFTPEFDRAYVDYLEQLVAHAKAKKWPPFCLHAKDEPGGSDLMYYANYYYKLIKQTLPAIKTYWDGGPWVKEDVTLSPYVDILSYAAPSQEVLAAGRQTGSEIWTYNNGGWGRSGNAKIDRDRWGLFQDKIGSGAHYMWVYFWWVAQTVPPCWHPAFQYVVPAPDGPIPTDSWEACREGIKDTRYLATLRALIAKARNSDRWEVRKGAALADGQVQDVLNGVRVDWSEREGYFSQTAPEQWDLNRWKLAAQIVTLQDLLAGKTSGQSAWPVPTADGATLGLWHFDEGTGKVVRDDRGGSSRQGSDGQIMAVKGAGVPLWTRGIHGEALHFAPKINPVAIDLKAPINPATFSVEAWIFCQDIGKDAAYIASQGSRWIVRLREGGVVNFVLNNNGWKELSVGKIRYNVWHHVACTYDGQFMRIWIDGRQAAVSRVSGPIGGEGSRVVIGGAADGKAGSFWGRIDEVRLSSTARTYRMPWNDGEKE